ncbi:hypothetical protein AYI70_g2225 [Smittium culicis]|uniref:Secreted protein n=1 Tax=Smittium culicis TaxID=133412 RepID=A0A1R1Y994_9FUNG|nr:hypothetical protein AYI70_g2225 [Smittium culicis]
MIIGWLASICKGSIFPLASAVVFSERHNHHVVPRGYFNNFAEDSRPVKVTHCYTVSLLNFKQRCGNLRM